MHGNIQEVFVSEGQVVQKGQPLLILEAMKMQHELCAQVSGQVAHVYAKVGVQVKADAILIVIAPQEVGKAK
jgi:biotin carboxyl carrier protein